VITKIVEVAMDVTNYISFDYYTTTAGLPVNYVFTGH